MYKLVLIVLLATITFIECKPCGSSHASGGSTKPCATKTFNPYSYQYTAVVGRNEDGMIGSKQAGDATGKVTGSYTLMDPDGRYRYVYYVADSKGYRATIKTNEPGTANENPANVVIQSSYSTPAAPTAEPSSMPGSSGYGGSQTTSSPNAGYGGKSPSTSAPSAGYGGANGGGTNGGGGYGGYARREVEVDITAPDGHPDLYKVYDDVLGSDHVEYDN